MGGTWRMSSSQLYSELDILNIIIAMSLEQKSSGIDNIFYQEGYRIVSIDRSVDTDLGTIKYDIYLSNLDKNLSFGFEIKGFKASNLELEQLEKYKNIPVKQYLVVGGAFYKDIDTHQLQTIIGVNKSSERHVTEFIKLHGFTFPILSIDREKASIQIVCERIIDNEIYTKLSTIMYNSSGISPYIHYDKESKLYEIAPRLINKIFQLAKIDCLEFSVDRIVEETYCSIPDLHTIIGADVKKSVKAKIKKILKDMSDNEFSSYLSWDSQNKKWRIHKISSKSHQNTDTAFRQIGKQYVERLRQNANASDEGYEQLSLFDGDEMLEEVY
jgi:hypothetical protein